MAPQEFAKSPDGLIVSETRLRERFADGAVLLNPPEKGYISMPWVNQEIDTTLLSDAADLIAAEVGKRAMPVDKVVAVPTMGAYLGVAVAMKLKVPFMPGRKDGVRPGSWRKIVVIDEPIDSFTTDKPATFVFNGLEEGDNVLLVDDVIAHGNTSVKIANAFRARGVNVEIAVYGAKLFQEGVRKLREIGIDPIFVYGIEMDANRRLYLSPPRYASGNAGY